MGIEEFNEEWYLREDEENKERDGSCNYNIYCGLIMGTIINVLRFVNKSKDITMEDYEKLKKEVLETNKNLLEDK